MAMRALAALLFVAVILHLAGGVAAAAAFLIFSLGFLLPAALLASRAPYIRDLPNDLRVVASAIAVVLCAAPWFFLRKAIGMPMLVDLASCAMLIQLTRRHLANWTASVIAWRPADAPAALVIPLVFALVWMGYAVRVGDEVRFYGLFVVDFGNLVSVVSALRNSPALPLSYLEGGGPLNYHWLYFTLPAMLADFSGIGMSNAQALILTNLLVALLLLRTLVAVTRSHSVTAIVLFAPVALDLYQMLQARVDLGWLALPGRNSLLLTPLNSMIVFGNNSFALVLALFTIAALRRWTEKAKLGDATAGAVALAAMAGYSITLVLPLALALLVWTCMGRVRRPVVALLVMAGVGGAMALLLRAAGILGSANSRQVVVSFDGGGFAVEVLVRMVPLWGLALMRGRQPLTFNHVLIGAALAVPSLLYVSGSPTASGDFSMKIASLIAVAFAPLIAVPPTRRVLTTLLVVIGAAQSVGYVLQFPYYRVTGHGPGEAIPAHYHDALDWLRLHTPRETVVIDPPSVNVGVAVYSMIVAERRVWLPTRYTSQTLMAGAPADIETRAEAWELQALPTTGLHVVVTEEDPCAPGWTALQRFGPTSICAPAGGLRP